MANRKETLSVGRARPPERTQDLQDTRQRDQTVLRASQEMGRTISLSALQKRGRTYFEVETINRNSSNKHHPKPPSCTNEEPMRYDRANKKVIKRRNSKSPGNNTKKYKHRIQEQVIHPKKRDKAPIALARKYTIDRKKDDQSIRKKFFRKEKKNHFNVAGIPLFKEFKRIKYLKMWMQNVRKIHFLRKRREFCKKFWATRTGHSMATIREHVFAIRNCSTLGIEENCIYGNRYKELLPDKCGVLRIVDNIRSIIETVLGVRHRQLHTDELSLIWYIRLVTAAVSIETIETAFQEIKSKLTGPRKPRFEIVLELKERVTTNPTLRQIRNKLTGISSHFYSEMIKNLTEFQFFIDSHTRPKTSFCEYISIALGQREKIGKYQRRIDSQIDYDCRTAKNYVKSFKHLNTHRSQIEGVSMENFSDEDQRLIQECRDKFEEIPNINSVFGVLSLETNVLRNQLLSLVGRVSYQFRQISYKNDSLYQDYSSFSHKSSAVQHKKPLKELIKIKEKWEELLLKTESLRGKLHILTNISEVRNTIEEDLVNIEHMKLISSKNSELSQWKKDLKKMLRVIETWSACQDLLVSLEPIFNSSYMQDSFPTQQKSFSSTLNSYTEFTQIPAKAKQHLLSDEVFSNLSDYLSSLQTLRKNLKDLLENHRESFPRFFFLSDTELIDFISSVHSQSSFDKHISCMFPGVRKLYTKPIKQHLREGSEFQAFSPASSKKVSLSSDIELGGMYPFEALGMIGYNDELLVFEKPVSIHEGIEGWMSEIEKSMRETLARMISYSVSAFPKESLDEWVLDFPQQVIYTSVLLILTHEITELLEDKDEEESEDSNSCVEPLAGNVPSVYQEHFTKVFFPSLAHTETMEPSTLELMDLLQQKSLGGLFLRLQFWVNQLTKSIEADSQRRLSSMQIMNLRSLVYLLCYQRDIVQTLINKKVQNITDFEWQKLLRVYWNSSENISKVEIGGLELMQGHEYIGNSIRFLITPITTRYFLFLSSSIRETSSVCFKTNVNHDSAWDVFQEFASLCGISCKRMIVNECTDLPMTLQYLNGSALANIWLLLEFLDKLPILHLQAISKEIQMVQQQFLIASLTVTQQTIEVEDSSSSISNQKPPSKAMKHSGSLFVVMGSVSPAVDKSLVRNLKCSFRTLRFGCPPLVYIATVMLIREGFKLQSFIGKALQALRNSLIGYYEVSARDVMIIFIIAKTLKIDQEDETHAVARAAYLYIKTKLDSDEVVINAIQGAFKERAELKNEIKLKDGIEEEAKSLGLKIDGFEKCEELYTALRIHRTVIVNGPSLSGKTSLLQVIFNYLRKKWEYDFKNFYLNPNMYTYQELFDEILPDMAEQMKEKGKKWLRITCKSPLLWWAEPMLPLMEANPILHSDISSLEPLEFGGNSMLSSIENTLTLPNGTNIFFPPSMQTIIELEDMANLSPNIIARVGICNISDFNWEYLMEELYMTVDPSLSVRLKIQFQSKIKNIIQDCNANFNQNTKELMVSYVKILKSYIAKEIKPNEPKKLDTAMILGLVWSFGSSVPISYRPYFHEMCAKHLENPPPDLFSYFYNWTRSSFVKVYLEEIVYHVFETSQGINLIGEPGSGKSSLTKSISYQKHCVKYSIDPSLKMSKMLSDTKRYKSCSLIVIIEDLHLDDQEIQQGMKFWKEYLQKDYKFIGTSHSIVKNSFPNFTLEAPTASIFKKKLQAMSSYDSKSIEISANVFAEMWKEFRSDSVWNYHRVTYAFAKYLQKLTEKEQSSFESLLKYELIRSFRDGMIEKDKFDEILPKSLVSVQDTYLMYQIHDRNSLIDQDLFQSICQAIDSNLIIYSTESTLEYLKLACETKGFCLVEPDSIPEERNRNVSICEHVSKISTSTNTSYVYIAQNQEDFLHAMTKYPKIINSCQIIYARQESDIKSISDIIPSYSNEVFCEIYIYLNNITQGEFSIKRMKNTIKLCIKIQNSRANLGDIIILAFNMASNDLLSKKSRLELNSFIIKLLADNKIPSDYEENRKEFYNNWLDLLEIPRPKSIIEETELLECLVFQHFAPDISVIIDTTGEIKPVLANTLGMTSIVASKRNLRLEDKENIMLEDFRKETVEESLFKELLSKETSKTILKSSADLGIHNTNINLIHYVTKINKKKAVRKIKNILTKTLFSRKEDREKQLQVVKEYSKHILQLFLAANETNRRLKRVPCSWSLYLNIVEMVSAKSLRDALASITEMSEEIQQDIDTEFFTAYVMPSLWITISGSIPQENVPFLALLFALKTSDLNKKDVEMFMERLLQVSGHTTWKSSLEKIVPSPNFETAYTAVERYPDLNDLYQHIKNNHGTSKAIKKALTASKLPIFPRILLSVHFPDQTLRTLLRQFIYSHLSRIFTYSEDLKELHYFIKAASWSIPIILFSTIGINIVKTLCSIANYYGVGLEVIRIDPELDSSEPSETYNLIFKCIEEGSWALISTSKFPFFLHGILSSLDDLRKTGLISNAFRMFIDVQGLEYEEIPESILHRRAVSFYMTEKNLDDIESYNDVWNNVLYENLSEIIDSFY